jgi:hypothetical protein
VLCDEVELAASGVHGLQGKTEKARQQRKKKCKWDATQLTMFKDNVPRVYRV